MLDFQRIHFSKKRGLGNVTPLLLNQMVNLLSQIIRFQVDAPFEDFLIVITNFLGALSQVLRIFWFQALWKSHFENKRNF